VAHVPSDLTSGAIRKEADCPECGKVTTHEWILFPGAPFVGQREMWHWVCTGLSAEERAAGK